ncbi:MAG: hypothetical protein DMD95_22110 [Candidatus Rokuibacteriota bacterium]|nr:MAG: hypothetical protein DMD95_22110 [Candidatus Rokubacteria bacterium]
MDELRLCLVTDRTQTRGRELAAVVGDCLAAGLPAVQVREKDLGAADLAFVCRRLRALTLDRQALLIVNDRVDVALAVGADAVQRTSTSLPIVRLPVIAIGGITPERVREVLGAGARGVAAIAAILAADSPADATRRFLEVLDRRA